MINERVRLSIGATGAQRAVFVVVGLMFAAIGAAFVALPFLADNLFGQMLGTGYECVDAGELPPGFPPELLPESDCDSPLGAFRFVGLIGVPFALLGLYFVARALRTAAWLDGTRAEVRGAVLTRSVDLSTAEITAGAITGADAHVRIPTLVARDPANGRRVTIILRGAAGGHLPPHELRALADAITRDRAGDGGDAHAIARQLRELAERPLAI